MNPIATDTSVFAAPVESGCAQVSRPAAEALSQTMAKRRAEKSAAAAERATLAGLGFGARIRTADAWRRAL